VWKWSLHASSNLFLRNILVCLLYALFCVYFALLIFDVFFYLAWSKIYFIAYEWSLFCFVRKVIHTVGPKYAVKYHTAAENALSHCYRSCLELLIENGLRRFKAALVFLMLWTTWILPYWYFFVIKMNFIWHFLMQHSNGLYLYRVKELSPRTCSTCGHK